jgi:transposase-like protein
MEQKKLVSKEQLRQFIKDNELKNRRRCPEYAARSVFRDLQEMLEAELDHNLSYQKNDVKNKQTSNRRNGHSKKTVQSEYGETEITVPRDRDGDFEPIIVKKHQKSVAGIEDQILALYMLKESVPAKSRTICISSMGWMYHRPYLQRHQ